MIMMIKLMVMMMMMMNYIHSSPMGYIHHSSSTLPTLTTLSDHPHHNQITIAFAQVIVVDKLQLSPINDNTISPQPLFEVIFGHPLKSLPIPLTSILGMVCLYCSLVISIMNVISSIVAYLL